MLYRVFVADITAFTIKPTVVPGMMVVCAWFCVFASTPIAFCESFGHYQWLGQNETSFLKLSAYVHRKPKSHQTEWDSE